MPNRRIVLRALAAAATAACALWLWAEFVEWRASHRLIGPHATSSARHSTTNRTDAVVVLGFRNRGKRANFVNRFRVRAGVRSLDPTATGSLLVLCGGAVGSATPEALIMHRYAREALGFRGDIAVDPDSTSTWENIRNAIPHIEHADTIKIVSNAPHAEMGREILWRQRPDLAARLVRGAEHRLGEAPLLKILSALRIAHSRVTGSRVSRARPPRGTARAPR